MRETFGVITYQEQVQQIARELAGYSLAEADLLRRAMGKKIKAEMDAQRGRFLEGASERGIPPATAEAVFDACAKFAEYGFNKSHSAPLRAPHLSDGLSQGEPSGGVSSPPR